MNIRMPTDLDPTGGIARPDQATAPVPQPMPTLADFGVPVRAAGNSSVAAPISKPRKRS